MHPKTLATPLSQKSGVATLPTPRIDAYDYNPTKVTAESDAWMQKHYIRMSFCRTFFIYGVPKRPVAYILNRCYIITRTYITYILRLHISANFSLSLVSLATGLDRQTLRRDAAFVHE